MQWCFDNFIQYRYAHNYIEGARLLPRTSAITKDGSAVYIGIPMVFVFSPYIRKFNSYLQFQVNLTLHNFTAQNM